MRSQKGARLPRLTWFRHFRRAQEEGVAGVAQEAVDLLGPGPTHAAALLDGLDGATAGAEVKRRSTQVHFTLYALMYLLIS